MHHVEVYTMYKRENRSWLKHLDFTLLDILSLQFAFNIVYMVYLRAGFAYSDEWYMRLGAVIVLVQICVVFFTEPYKDILKRDKIQELKKVFIIALITYFGVSFYIYAFKLVENYSRIVLGGTFALFAPISYFCHLVWKSYVRMRILEDKNRSVMILLTANDTAEPIIREFEKNRYRNFVIKGIVIMDKDRTGEEIREVPIVAGVDTFMDYIRTHVVDEVFINSNDISVSEKLCDDLLEMGVTVHFKLMHESQLMPNKTVEKCGNYMVLTSSMNIASPRQLFLKRVMDICGAIVGLILAAIAFVIFAPIIKKQSPGPVFFKQVRVGKNGRRFKLYKFRSMYMDAEARKAELMSKNEMQGNIFKMADDPRIIPIGKFMRKYSIDELPQFFNILKGDMSLVGTRPPTEDEFIHYASHHKARLGIKPGLTGMWQVSGRSNITDFEEIVELDTAYISNWNLAMDIRILFKTIGVVIKGNGAG